MEFWSCHDDTRPKTLLKLIALHLTRAVKLSKVYSVFVSTSVPLFTHPPPDILLVWNIFSYWIHSSKVLAAQHFIDTPEAKNGRLLWWTLRFPFAKGAPSKYIFTEVWPCSVQIEVRQKHTAEDRKYSLGIPDTMTDTRRLKLRSLKTKGFSLWLCNNLYRGVITKRESHCGLWWGAAVGILKL